MTSGVPAPASVDLFNKLIRLPGSNKQEIGQIEFRLRALQKKKPTDLRTTLALLQALTMLGKTSEAIETADYLDTIVETGDLEGAVDEAFDGVDWEAFEEAWKNYTLKG